MLLRFFVDDLRSTLRTGAGSESSLSEDDDEDEDEEEDEELELDLAGFFLWLLFFFVPTAAELFRLGGGRTS